MANSKNICEAINTQKDPLKNFETEVKLMSLLKSEEMIIDLIFLLKKSFLNIYHLAHL